MARALAFDSGRPAVRANPTRPHPRAELKASMPRKGSSEDGVKSKGRSKADKQRRNFELNGTYSAKHLRLKEAEREKQARKPKE